MGVLQWMPALHGQQCLGWREGQRHFESMEEIKIVAQLRDLSKTLESKQLDMKAEGWNSKTTFVGNSSKQDWIAKQALMHGLGDDLHI